MSDLEKLEFFPKWRQAVKDFLAEFAYGDIVTHDWLADHFGMPTLDEDATLTATDFRERQFAWLGSIEAFKTELLNEHQVCLQSIFGRGYRWAFPAEQTHIAMESFTKDARRAFRTVDKKLKNIRVAELSSEQRRENLDAVTKVSMLRGMSIKNLK